MSALKPVLVSESDPKFILLGIAPDGGQSVANLLAYGPDPAIPGATLIFTTMGPNFYEEFRLMIDFSMFKVCMDGTQYMDIMDIDRSRASIPPNSELGALARDFKARHAAALFPDIADTLH